MGTRECTLLLSGQNFRHWQNRTEKFWSPHHKAGNGAGKQNQNDQREQLRCLEVFMPKELTEVIELELYMVRGGPVRTHRGGGASHPPHLCFLCSCSLTPFYCCFVVCSLFSFWWCFLSDQKLETEHRTQNENCMLLLLLWVRWWNWVAGKASQAKTPQ